MSLLSIPSRPPLRGSTKRSTDLMEAFQVGYIRAVAAAAGAVIVGVPEIDEGVDVVLSHTSASHTAVPESKVLLEVQLKSTHSGQIGENATASMRADRFNYYATTGPTLHKIVVVMRLPADMSNWTIASHTDLRLSHCAYWVNLAGSALATGASKSVSAPSGQIFDDVALCDMMERIGQGGAP